MTKKVQASEIISLAQGILSTSVLCINRKEFGCYDLAAILPINIGQNSGLKKEAANTRPTYIAFETLQVIGTPQSPNKLPSESLTTFLANASRTPWRLGVGTRIRSRPLSWGGPIALIRLSVLSSANQTVRLLNIVTRRGSPSTQRISTWCSRER